jgi:micrococcal nuclease
MKIVISILVVSSFLLLNCSQSGRRQANSAPSDKDKVSQNSSETTDSAEQRNPDYNPSSVNDQSSNFNVTKVVDGDTFWVDDGTEKGAKIRLIGVDAPESRNSFKKKVGYFGSEAKSYLTGLLSHQGVRLEYDLNRTDQYGRTLAYVYLQDGTFVNAELVKNGYAMVMTIPPNVKYAEVFLELQQEVRNRNAGLWKE